MESRRDRLIAALLTLLLAGLTLSVLLTARMHASPATLPEASQPDDSEVFFADIEYKSITAHPTPEVDANPASAAASAVSGDHLDDAGGGESAPDPVASPMPAPEGQQVAKPQEPKPAAPTKEEIEAEKRARIRNRIGAAMSSSTSQQEQSTGSATTGSATTGNNTASSGLGLNGRKLLNRPDPGIKNASGNVKVRVTVNAEGTVTAVSFVTSSGFGSREKEVRDACLKASKALRYSPEASKPSQSGIITWIIK